MRTTPKDAFADVVAERLANQDGDPYAIARRQNGRAMTSVNEIPFGSYGASDDEIFERRVNQILDRELATREARRRLKVTDRGDVPPPVVETLRERLARPRTQPTWRIENWQPSNTRVILTAQFKAGKTTAVGNTIRALVDGDRFLGREAVTPMPGNVGLLDLEMSTYQLDDWLGQQGIRNDDRVTIIPARGKSSSFNILDDGCRAEWAARLREAKINYLVLDCLRPVLDALGLDEHREAGRFLVAYDELLLAAQVPDSLVVHHMGHTGERSRGDSRLRDWPDVEWRLVRKDEDPNSSRFITAFGRDVDVPESQLEYDLEKRRLTITGGNRKDSATRDALPEVLALLTGTSDPLSVRGIQAALAEADIPRAIVRDAIKYGVRTGAIDTIPGPNRSILHRLGSSSVPACRSVPETVGTPVDQCAAAYIRRRTGPLDLAGLRAETTNGTPHDVGTPEGDRFERL